MDPVITYTLASLRELVNVRPIEAQADGFLCYKCKYIFGFYYITSPNYRILQKGK